MAIGYGRLSAVKKAGTAIGRAAHHGGHKLSHGAAGRAAYLSADRIVGNDPEMVTDYTKKFGVEHSELVLPGGGTCDREKLWNAVDAHKTQRETADVAYDMIVAFPHELSFVERKEAARKLAGWISDRYQVAVDYGMHLPETHKGSSEKNFHGHYLISARIVTPDGELGKVQRQLNHRVCQQIDESRGRTERVPTAAKEIRMAWERIANGVLDRGGYAERIDMHSRNTSPSRHLGAAETRRLRAEQRTTSTVRGVRAELGARAHELCARRMAALQTIAEIQQVRREERSAPQVVADIGSLEAWQRDAGGMLARYWAAEDRAMELRRRLRNAARRHAEMREATKDEDAQLRSAGRMLSRSKKSIGRVKDALSRLDGLPDEGRLAIEPSDRAMSKARLDEIDRALNTIETATGGTGHDNRGEDMSIREKMDQAKEWAKSKLSEHGLVPDGVAHGWAMQQEAEEHYVKANKPAAHQERLDATKEWPEEELKEPPFNDPVWSRPWRSDVDKAARPEQSYDEWQAQVRKKYAEQERGGEEKANAKTIPSIGDYVSSYAGNSLYAVDGVVTKINDDKTVEVWAAKQLNPEICRNPIVQSDKSIPNSEREFVNKLRDSLNVSDRPRLRLREFEYVKDWKSDARERRASRSRGDREIEI